MAEYFSKFVNSYVYPPSSLVTLVYPLVFCRHPLLLHIISGIVRKTRTAETYAMVRKKLVESTGDDPHVSVALELFLQDMIEENNRRIIGRCRSCNRGYTALDQSVDGKCQSCANRDRRRS